MSAGVVGAFRPLLAHASSPADGIMLGRGYLDGRAVAFGRRDWAGHGGVLVFGDCWGNHLCYRWREAGTARQLDLHGWEPFTETVAVVRRMVDSTP